ncbi:Uncharacterised protein [BD1-7 clade bacterium]|uniref:Uncharacterized protein n=1 Tax=BD1-7 clade bacterium TaxID=2029982 RepID=A0A5S9PC43_9GAMM|nr:Uncharacterised protein [BD1-7 clade bacterium]CAA0102030.1 Uncharacterised protein [BD1-7 clade bacterium]
MSDQLQRAIERVPTSVINVGRSGWLVLLILATLHVWGTGSGEFIYWDQ